MTTYDLYLESGPRRRKTMTHVLDLLGCVAVGPTTEDAVGATPAAIRAFLRFLRRHGAAVDPDASFATRIAEHITQGGWLGNGSPYLIFAPDLEPLSESETERLLTRFVWLSAEWEDWVAAQSASQLDAVPAEGGRPARAVLLHTLNPGGYLSAALGGAPGFSRLQTRAERGEIALPEALHRVSELVSERVHAATAEQRAAGRETASGVRTLHKALRRTLEHSWEHLAELSRREGGPAL